MICVRFISQKACLTVWYISITHLIKCCSLVIARHNHLIPSLFRLQDELVLIFPPQQTSILLFLLEHMRKKHKYNAYKYIRSFALRVKRAVGLKQSSRAWTHARTYVRTHAHTHTLRRNTIVHKLGSFFKSSILITQVITGMWLTNRILNLKTCFRNLFLVSKYTTSFHQTCPR